MDKASGGSIQRTVTYYPVAGAMRINSTLYYTLKDHLGSASVVTDASGNILGENRYYPYGETRLTTGTIFTDKLFTSQREMAGLGIYHYGARFYSPKLGRFLSADTIVPGAANPQAYNRYSYVLNNPLRYTDPTGHCIDGLATAFCLVGVGKLLVDVVTVVVGVVVLANISSREDDWRHHNPKQQEITKQIESTYNQDLGNGFWPDPNSKLPKCGFWCKFGGAAGGGFLVCVLMFENNCIRAASSPNPTVQPSTTACLSSLNCQEYQIGPRPPEYQIGPIPPTATTTPPTSTSTSTPSLVASPPEILIIGAPR